ncbi:DUF4138 domain-containing protein [Cellulophaga baltica]|uniref:DUF4138 domain-containing protein n=1 Tax=Cellulophaga TaxID=104264 RepID=UPI001C07ABB7|nr:MULTISPECIES: DUF4138 domain-containing protein [Cellulophaga]MBU2997499.1 DUF4138 domain-containing protein [Cellulophaga baltica]MDO6768895.1 DUF4138 domain-containing protein [Cellulophaga sp. 1_MG-2023]
MSSKYFKIFLFIIVFVTQLTYARVNGPITITINENNTITLIFPTEIANVVSPSSDFQFSYDDMSNMGILKTKKTKQLSNLTVTTIDGNIYSFLLQPSNKVVNFVYILTASDAVGSINASNVIKSENNTKIGATDMAKENTIETEIESQTLEVEKETPSIVIENKQEEVTADINKEEQIEVVEANTKEELIEEEFTVIEDLYSSEPEMYYQIFCENMPNEKPSIKNVHSKISVIDFKLNTIVFDKNEMYFELEIINNSAKVYPLNDLNFHVKSWKGTAFKVEPLYLHNYPEKLEKNTSYKIISVLKNTKLSKKQQLYITLNCFDNDRFIMLQPSNELINR